MVTSNLLDTNSVGSASMQNGDFLTFDGLVKNKFAVVIPNFQNVSFFMQTFELPSVNVREIALNTPIVDYNEIGEKLKFEPFNITFIVDKYARNWTQCFNWMKEMTAQGSNVGRTEDVVLMLDGKEFIRFYGCWPTMLSGIELDSTIQDVQYIKATLTLNYDYFEIINQFATTDSVYN